MESRPAIPTLQRGRYNNTRGRKYGGYDFERFDHLSSSHADIGHQVFDKVNINCRFLFKKSKWGVIGEHKNPAGIIYLDLIFDQPKDSQLHSATVTVTLEDDSPELSSMRNVLGWKQNDRSQCPVQMTDCYGPKAFTGQEKIVMNKKSLHLTPNAQFSGIGFGGLGMDKESFSKHSSRWRFSGHLLPGKGRQSWAYKSLKWNLSENEDRNQPTHANEFHTAFTFEHGGQPFFMRVEITGKLKKLHGRLKDKIMKFPPSSRADNSAVTLINFGERSLFKIPLDERARELDFEMEMANMNAILMEVPDPKPANFLSLPNNYRRSDSSLSSQPYQWRHEAQSLSLSQQQEVTSIPHPQALLDEDATEPTLANLAQAFNNRQSFHRPLHHNVPPNNLTYSNVEVVESVGNDDGHAILDEETSSTDSGDTEETVGANPVSEEQMLIQLLRMPGLLTLMRIVALLTGLFGFTDWSPPTPIVVHKTVSEDPTLQRGAGAANKRHTLVPNDLLLSAAGNQDLILDAIRRERLERRRSRRGKQVAKEEIILQKI